MMTMTIDIDIVIVIFIPMDWLFIIVTVEAVTIEPVMILLCIRRYGRRLWNGNETGVYYIQPVAGPVWLLSQ